MIILSEKENEILSLMAGMELGMILSELKVREEKNTKCSVLFMQSIKQTNKKPKCTDTDRLTVVARGEGSKKNATAKQQKF